MFLLRRVRSNRLTLLLFTACFLFASAAGLFADSAKVPTRYKHWVNEEVPYIISSQERQQFLSLASDAERDSFIQAFWNLRNPEPGSDTNSYKEEHYRRLAYANQVFGNPATGNGWRTDQGRIVITLGEPQQRMSYLNARNVRPILIWFYESKSPALPTHFYVMFYKRSVGEEFTLYSPYQDGPSRLTTGLEDLNVQERSLQTIRKSLGDEVARTTISLIPGEPVNLNEYSPSMQSDVMLSTIRGLADNELTRQQLEAHRGREIVSSRIFTGPGQAEIEAGTFREADGRQTVSFLMIPHDPIRGLTGKLPNGQTGYSLRLETVVTTAGGKRVYQTEDGLRGITTEQQATAAAQKSFAAEGRLPLTAGEYQIEATLTNELTHASLRETHNIVVPDENEKSWTMSSLLAFSQHIPGKVVEKIPFSVAGVRFVPRGFGEVSLHASDPLWLAFQIWSGPGTAAALTGHKVRLTYSYGRIQSGSAAPVTETEEVEGEDFDISGSLLTGHMIPTTGLDQGSYRVVVTAQDEVTLRKAYASMPLHVVSPTLPTGMWTAYSSDGSGARSDAMDDYKRGLSSMAQAKNDGAATWFSRSLAEDAQYLPALDRLVDVLSAENKFNDVAALSKKYPVTHELQEKTAILMAQANAHAGDSAQGARILEAELQFQPPSASLYMALAKIYQERGDAAKAAEFSHKAASLKN